ncbi:glycosyltransferase family 39 protein [Litoreibacter halocynthiae]|uniref:glycosyltransferase family 39 protein n=1 Tax=Litoreibacter halocynthiae TaxID=1242689 RepID=UPI0013C33128|nr:glycosyltransferase family 39 protein [Litoreibacter halocynthiae]
MIYIGLCALFWKFVADDAYIVGRYAQNAAAGNGLVYNLGEQVSALTSPLHGLLESALAVIGFDPVDSYRIIAPLLVLAGWLVALRQTGIRATALVLFTALSLFSPFLALWTVGGLETPLLVCLSTMLVARLVLIKRANHVSGREFMVLGLLAALMFLTRYDSVLVTVPVLLAILIVEYRRPSIWAGAAFSLALASSWLLFAQLYYGDIFPTSYYIKLAIGGRAPIDSLSALLNFGLLSGLFLIVLFVRPTATDKRLPLSKAIMRGATFSVILFLLYASRASGQHMMFGYRLFVPYLMGAALVLSLTVINPRPALSALFVGWQAAMVAVVTFIGVNPAPLTRLPGLDRAYAEYEFLTPSDFRDWMVMIKDDAAEIAAHWASQELDARPSIYLRSGGMGYHLPDFYVFETLVSYRHGCGLQVADSIAASHYLQQLGFSLTGNMVQDLGRARPDIADDAELLFATTLDWDGPRVTGYLFGSEPTPLDLSAKLDAGCTSP